MTFFIKYKDGSEKNYKVKDFIMKGSTICIETDDDILYLDYSDIEDFRIINP